MEHPFDDIAEPFDGQKLEVGGFVFADTFDRLLREMSGDYLRVSWDNLSGVLGKHGIEVNDPKWGLSWGWMHNGETAVPNFPGGCDLSSPDRHTGWTSKGLANIYQDDFDKVLDEQVMRLNPPLRCLTTQRSVKWPILPTDFERGLQLIEYFWTAESGDWNPRYVRSEPTETYGLAVDIADAIYQGDASRLNAAIIAAQDSYSKTGINVVVQGFRYWVRRNSAGVWKIYNTEF